MKIALSGYGQMGKEVERLALDAGIKVAARIDPRSKDADCAEISLKCLKGAEVCIDFSQPDAAIENIRRCAAAKTNMVVGTTGWYGEMDEVRSLVKRSGIGFIYASNFSVGVNLFFRIVRNSARLMDKFPEYDVSGFEMHHMRKKDSPSGTAKSLSEIIIGEMGRKEKAVYEKLDRKPEKNELHFASARCGEVPGTHSIYFDSPADTIELKHTARSRAGLAAGALKAAEWIRGKRGFYTIDDLMDGGIGE